VLNPNPHADADMYGQKIKTALLLVYYVNLLFWAKFHCCWIVLPCISSIRWWSAMKKILDQKKMVKFLSQSILW